MLDYLIPNNKKKEKVNQTILHNNHYHNNIINTIQQKTKKQCQKMNYDVHSHKEKKKWVTFTFVGKEVYHITKLFRKQILGVALKIKINLSKILNRNTDK